MAAPYYQHDGITIYHGDNRELIGEIIDQHGQPDHVITDPPYAPETHCGARSSAGGIVYTLIDYQSASFRDIYYTLSLIQPARWCIATMDYRHVVQIEHTPPGGYRFVRFGVWTKPNGAPQFTGDRPAQGWEAVAILHNNLARLRWNAGGDRAVWTYPVAKGGYAGQKPVDLYRRWIEDFTDPGDLILDPWVGAGTLLRAAKDLGRRAIGIDVSAEACAVAAAQLAQGVLALT